MGSDFTQNSGIRIHSDGITLESFELTPYLSNSPPIMFSDPKTGTTSATM